MMWYGNGMGGWGFALMMVGNVLFWAATWRQATARPGCGLLPRNCSPNGSLGARSTSRSTEPASTR